MPMGASIFIPTFHLVRVFPPPRVRVRDSRPRCREGRGPRPPRSCSCLVNRFTIQSKLQKPYIDFTLTQTNTGFTIYTHAACWGPTHTLTHFKNTAVALRLFSHLSSGTDLARCGARTAPTLDGAAGGACVLPEPPPTTTSAAIRPRHLSYPLRLVP